MLKTLKKKKGFVSIVEVIVTSVIFILTAFGLFATITMLRPAGVDVSKRLDAAYAGKKFIEDLRNTINSYTEGVIYSNDIVVSPTMTLKSNWYVDDTASPGVRQLFLNVYY